MSSFIIKLIAVISMLCDHAGYAIYGRLSWLNGLGRVSFPLFAFQVAEGYTHTSNLKKYYLRLFIFALISQIPYMMFCSIFTSDCPLNIFFTLLIGLLAITIYDKSSNKTIGILGVLSMAYLGHFLNADYCKYGYGIFIIFIYYILKDKKIYFILSYIILTILFYLKPLHQTSYSIEIIVIVLSSFIPAFLILLYNGKKGKDLKFFFYWIYPVHLTAFYFINLLFFNANKNHIENLNYTYNFIINYFKNII